MSAAEPVFLTILFVVIRVGVAFAIVPSLGGNLIPDAVRLAAALAVAIAVGPAISESLPPALLSGPVQLVVLAIREVFVGLALGLVAAIGVLAAQMAGRLIDFQLFARADGPYAQLLLLLAAAIFFVSGAHRVLIAAVVESYRALPLAGSHLGANTVDVTARAITALVITSLSLAAPFLLALLIADLAIAIAARMAPRAHMAILFAPVRGILAVIIALGSLLALGPAIGRAAQTSARAVIEAASRLAK